ncbi:MAG: DUF1059 domain-containing protein [Candidatus Thermoplasmatota archaeon]|nr:DUF1059 domain-containing protein [Candidatus Thermoplasmatota archaeon]
MAKSYRCSDIGIDCGWKGTAETTEELMMSVAAHAKSVHDIDPVPPELAEKVMSVIRDI